MEPKVTERKYVPSNDSNEINFSLLAAEMEIYDEDQLTEYEVIRQRNIIANYEYMKSCGRFIETIPNDITYISDCS